VVAADGVNSFIAQAACIRAKEPAKQLAVGVKSVIGLPHKGFWKIVSGTSKMTASLTPSLANARRRWLVAAS
jgi:flavin-dependent dehydrogenase